MVIMKDGEERKSRECGGKVGGQREGGREEWTHNVKGLVCTTVCMERQALLGEATDNMYRAHGWGSQDTLRQGERQQGSAR